MGDETTLYRMFDGSGQLLYVGVTATVRGATRFGEHAKGKWWWPDVKALTVEHYMTREAAESAERRAIQSEAPLHNIVHNSRPCLVGRSAPAPRVSGWDRPGALAAEAARRRFVAFEKALGEVVDLLVGLGRADEPCIECGERTSPYSWDLSALLGDGPLMVVYRHHCHPYDPVASWWEQPRPLPEIDRVFGLDEVLLLRDQLQAKAEHGAPLVAPNVEPVVAGLAAHFPRVD